MVYCSVLKVVQCDRCAQGILEYVFRSLILKGSGTTNLSDLLTIAFQRSLEEVDEHTAAVRKERAEAWFRTALVNQQPYRISAGFVR
jgi:hypothetical protein